MQQELQCIAYHVVTMESSDILVLGKLCLMRLDRTSRWISQALVPCPAVGRGLAKSTSQGDYRELHLSHPPFFCHQLLARTEQVNGD